VRVHADSPAARAGLKRLDVIRGLDVTPIHNMAEMADALAKYHPGDKIRLEISRQQGGIGAPYTPERVELTVGQQPVEPPRPPVPNPDVLPPPPSDVEQLQAANARIQQLQQRIEQLEKRVQELEEAIRRQGKK
jgi:membrane-associated protease RseP (regulator of RpoE activity)